MKDSFIVKLAVCFVLALLLGIFLPKIARAGTPIAFQVVVSDSSFLVDSLDLCGQFDTLWPDTAFMDSVVVYEMVNGQPKVLVNYGQTKVNTVLQFFWRTPQSGEHILCVAGYWKGFKGCENCITMPSWVSPPKVIIKP